MAKTIQQIQDLIDQQTLDARQLINLVVDYLQDNPGGSGGSGGGVASVTGDLVDNTDPDNPVVNLILTDSNDVSWQVTISTEGALITTQIP